jgi:hypothetical protein
MLTIASLDHFCLIDKRLQKYLKIFITHLIQIKMEKLRRYSLPVRHRIVRTIAPKLFTTFQDLVFVGKQLAVVPRPMIRYIEKLQLKNLVGAEIGVAEGVNARSILERLDMKHLYLIDPFEQHISSYAMMLETLRPFEKTITHIRMTSHEAATHIPNGLDFVYIDGNHSYEFVRQDIHDYFPKVRDGGIIGGHDFSFRLPGVMRAVMECCHNYQVVPFIERCDWWIKKP